MQTVGTLCDRDAWLAIETIRDTLVQRGQVGVIVVADRHGETIGLLRMHGAALSSVNVATNKAFSAARLRRPSAETGRRMRETGHDIAYYGDPRVSGFGGGLPVFFGEQVVGSVAVSGLSDSEDEALSALGVAAILTSNKAGA